MSEEPPALSDLLRRLVAELDRLDQRLAEIDGLLATHELTDELHAAFGQLARLRTTLAMSEWCLPRPDDLPADGRAHHAGPEV
jgi:hypothetical protein